MLQDRRQFVNGLVPAMAVGIAGGVPAMGATPHTAVSIAGNQFLINGRPTYPGRVYQGHKIEGLLFTSRMVNAIVDDQNPTTRGVWAYPDGPWDPERNTNEFIANLPKYRACGLTSVGFNVQGGNPRGYGWSQPWVLSGFGPDGTLRQDYRERLIRVIEAADAIGMVVVLGMFYNVAKPALRDESALIQAVDNVTELLCAGGYGNVLIEIGNEINMASWRFDIVQPARSHELIQRVQKNSAHRLKTPARRLLVSTSFTRSNVPSDNYLAVADFVLIHGNGYPHPDGLRAMVKQIRQRPAYSGQPVLFNEDDHYDFDQPDNDMLAAVDEYAGWGYFDYRQVRERFADGYQSLPVDWGINSDRKKAFFTLLAQVTGGQPP